MNSLSTSVCWSLDRRPPTGHDLKLPKRLLEVQAKQKAGEAGAAKIYESIGVYLGYSAASYAEFYEGLENVMILGRVTSGTGCDIILAKARDSRACHLHSVPHCHRRG